MSKPCGPIQEETWTWNEETGDIEVHYDEPGPHYGIVGHSDMDSTGRIMAAAPEMARLLLDLQFVPQVDDRGTHSPYCPICDGYREHRSDCRLVAVLRKAGVLPTP